MTNNENNTDIQTYVSMTEKSPDYKKSSGQQHTTDEVLLAPSHYSGFLSVDMLSNILC
jgi:hypothetical protein